jgi:2-polyprenyl-6-methoxyphenol hydroxylase-like FAD-dependent oxidoreductase
MAPTEPPHVQVLIVGAGPVGLALACDLGWRGVHTLTVDQGTGGIPQPKTSGVNIRTMELCRRWGLRDRIRGRGLARGYARDRIWLTSLTGPEIARQKVPSLADDVAPPGAIETFMRIHQTEFDPILQAYALSRPSVAARYRTRCVGVEQDDSAVTATLADLEQGNTFQVTADYLVSCEGAGSEIRKALGIELHGNWNVNSSTNAYFRSREFLRMHDKGEGLIYSFIGPEGYWGYIFAINGTDLWQAQIRGLGDEKPTSSRDDVAALIRRMAGRDFEFELLDVMPWTRRQLLADRFRSGRIFLAGDAVHQMPPTATLGMNTGVAEAADLSWKLEAVLAGWGGADLLDSYEAERRPVADRNAAASLRLFRAGRVDNPPGPTILDDGAEGARLRAALGERLLRDAAHPATEGLQIGYRYRDSPICWPEAEEGPPESNVYRPSTYPGTRAPDAWLPDGTPLLDRFGRGFVLVRLGPEPPDASALRTASAARGVPLSVLDIDEPGVAALYEKRLVLVRPDGHVAWRGDRAPDDAGAVLDVARGAMSASPVLSGKQSQDAVAPAAQ